MASKTTNAMSLASVLKRFVVMDVPTDDQIAQRRQLLQEQLSEIEKTNFFDFENVDVPSLEADLNRKIAGLDLSQKMINLGYREISDLSFLGWRKKDTNLPAFIVTDSEYDMPFSIMVNPLGDGTINDLDDLDYQITPDLPEAFEKQFEATIIYLAKLAKKNRENYSAIKITAELTGIIPFKAREATIAAQESKVFDDILIIGEASNFVIDKVVKTKKNSLVAGWIEETQQLFLITAYNPTDLEKYLLNQHVA